jgi:hypothetical protein
MERGYPLDSEASRSPFAKIFMKTKKGERSQTFEQFWKQTDDQEEARVARNEKSMEASVTGHH